MLACCAKSWWRRAGPISTPIPAIIIIFTSRPDGELHDFPSDKVTVAGLPAPPKGTRLSRVDVIVRVRR